MAVNAADNDPIVFNRIYIAPPDHHLILENGYVRVTRGPKENRFRPAVDPLFRSAAYIYGSRVIGVVLTGSLDDGTAGLWTIKHRGGIAVVQSPDDAEVPSMPENALKAVETAYCVPLSEMAALLSRLSSENAEEFQSSDMEENEKTRFELQIAKQEPANGKSVMDIGKLSPYACPECHGVLSRIEEGAVMRYRCHTGHAYSADSLLAAITEKIEDTLWSAVRGVDESIILLNAMGDHYAARNQPKLAGAYFKKASEAATRAVKVKEAITAHEQLSNKTIEQQSAE